MQAVMTKTERVFAALNGAEADHVPVSAWWHDFEREWSPEGLAETTLEAYRKYDWDFVKVNPRATYYAEDWGTRYAQREGRQPDLIEPGVSSPQDLERVQRLDVNEGAYGEQLEALRLIGRDLGGEAPFIQTVFSPLAVMSRITGSTKYVQRLMSANEDDLLAALEAITQTLESYSQACIGAGAAGIFFATVEWGSADVITIDDYDRFCRPFDLRVLEAVKDGPFNVLHVCRQNNHLLSLLDYPVAAFHWAVQQEGNPSFSRIASKTERAVMGGVSQDETLMAAGPREVAQEVAAAIGEMAGRRLLVAPGCSIDPQTPDANLRALVQAVRRPHEAHS